jgi:DNA-binding CsgD family transcriptional regulator
MARLCERDYDAVLGIVAAAAGASAEEPLSADVFGAIHRLFPSADVFAYFEGHPADRSRRRLTISGGHRAWTDAERALHDRLRFENPLLPTPATVGHAWRTSDRVALDAFRRTDFYNLLVHPHRIEYAMEYWAASRSGLLRGFCLDASRRDFSDRDRDVLDILGRHLAIVLARLDPHLPDRAARLGLTSREAEVLAWAARGQTNAEIASQLSVSAHTVRKHLENTFARLGVHTRAAAVAVAYERELDRPRMAPLEASPPPQ